MTKKYINKGMIKCELKLENEKLLEYGKKRCSKCKEILNIKDFARGSYYKGTQYQNTVCKECINEQYYVPVNIEKYELKRENKRLLKIGKKKCSKCKEIFSIEDFFIVSAYKNTVYRMVICKECYSDKFYGEIGICSICGEEKKFSRKNSGICKECKEKIKPDLFCYTCNKIYKIKDLPEFYHNSTAPWKSRCYDCFKEGITNKNNEFTAYEKLKEIKYAEEIRKHPNNPKLGQVKCTEHDCRKWFSPKLWEFRNRLDALEGKKPGEISFYCSDECKQKCEKYRKKPATIMKEDYIRAHGIDGFIDREIREVQPELRKLVLDRDDNTCQKCGKKDYEIELHCHHIEGIFWDPLCSADIDMCVTLCRDCHKIAHSIPGCSPYDMRCDIENLSEGQKI